MKKPAKPTTPQPAQPQTTASPDLTLTFSSLQTLGAVSRGRPTRLTPAIHKAIIAAVRLGAPETRISALIGDKSLISMWKNAGRKKKSGIFFDFLNDLLAAEANFECFHLSNIHAAAAGSRLRPPDWHASDRMLKIKFPERYSDRRFDMSLPPGINLTDLTDDQLKLVAAGQNPFDKA